MAASGTIEIGGETYTWESPTLSDLMEFESTTKLSFADPQSYNSVRGRAYLAELCLRKNHPDITAGQILKWPAAVYPDLWNMIAEAIPIFTTVSRGQSPPEDKPAGEGGPDTGQTDTSPHVPSRSAGHPPAQDGSE